MIAPQFYHPIFLYTVILMTLICASNITNQNYTMIKRGTNNFIPAFIISTLYALFLGFRPLSSRYFCDTVNYVWYFNLYKTGFSSYSGNSDGDWAFEKLMDYCAQIMDVSEFFTIIALGYFLFTLWACKRFCGNNVPVTMLFMMGSISFYTYCTNGIRNGLACSGVLLFLSFLNGNKINKIIAFLIAIPIIGIHKSVTLPIFMAIVSIYFIKNFNYAYKFWILSIFISLVGGGAVSSLFASMGFDDRVSYLTTQVQDVMFSHTGFRWDFLIYSMMPVILGYYIVIKRGLRDRTYEFLLNTYTLSNAFWVMVIRANFSNRFAYLSWFMYPLVLVYPLLKMDIWGGNQGRELKNIMLAHVGFTWFMQTFYW